jgi:hypothetical protein
MDDTAIRARIRTMLETGALPCEEPGKTWAGRGAGTHCSACAETIRAQDIEFEVDLRSGSPIRLHRRCYEIWLEECEPQPTRG